MPNKPKRLGRKKSAPDPWHDSPETIRQFLDQREDFEQLCTEVAYILKKKILGSHLETSDITFRAKSLRSFLDKISRKKYKDAFSAVTDFAGVRVVCLYIDDIPKIEEIIKTEFDVVERVDKTSSHGVDRFGYGAVHFIVRLGKGSSGARYDDLKTLVCEIQLRTVAQDAWAIIEHHLVYKQESDIPKQLIRKLNRLAAQFEEADEQFERVRKERAEYLSSVRSQSAKPREFLDNDLNLDSFREYLLWKFNKEQLEAREGQVNRMFEVLDRQRYKKLYDLDKVINQTAPLREQYLDHLVPIFAKSRAAANQVGLTMFLAKDPYSETIGIPKLWRELETNLGR